MTTEEILLQTYDKELQIFEEWMLQNPKLPKKINKLLLLRFLKVYDFDIEAAKKLYLIFLETRKKNPQLFQNRDVLSEAFQSAMSTLQVVGLKKLTNKNHKITIYKMTSSDAKYSIFNSIRLVSATFDCRFIQCDDNELINGEVSIIDMSNFTFSRLKETLLHIGTLKAHLRYIQEAAPITLIQNHLINCPSFINKLIAVIRPFINAEVWETMIFHSSLESLYEYVPRDMLPVDYGGTCEPMEELFEEAKKNLESYREYLLCDDNWRLED